MHSFSKWKFARLARSIPLLCTDLSFLGIFSVSSGVEIKIQHAIQAKEMKRHMIYLP